MNSLALVRPTTPYASMSLPFDKLIVALVAVMAIITTAISATDNATVTQPTQTAVYTVQWAADRPIGITESGDTQALGVDLTVLRHERGTQALFRITDAESPILYQFNGSIPNGHTGHVQADGSVTIKDVSGNTTGIIAAPWAYDANGMAVPTYYNIDGSTLIQTVEHHGAAYPVVADPWILVPYYIYRTYRMCSAVGCIPVTVAVLTFVSRYVTSGDSSSAGGRPTNKCNMRNRSGC